MKKRGPLTKAHYAGIGHVIAEWAILEQAMIAALGALMKAKKAETILAFWHSSYSEKRDRICALYGLYDALGEVIHKEFDTLINRLETANDVRNVIAHSQWKKGKTPRSIVPLIIKARSRQLKVTRFDPADELKKHELKPREFTSQSLHSEAEKISRLYADFRQFFTQHFGAEFFFAVPSKK